MLRFHDNKTSLHELNILDLSIKWIVVFFFRPTKLNQTSKYVTILARFVHRQSIDMMQSWISINNLWCNRQTKQFSLKRIYINSTYMHREHYCDSMFVHISLVGSFTYKAVQSVICTCYLPSQHNNKVHIRGVTFVHL